MAVSVKKIPQLLTAGQLRQKIYIYQMFLNEKKVMKVKYQIVFRIWQHFDVIAAIVCLSGFSWLFAKLLFLCQAELACLRKHIDKVVVHVYN